MIEDIHSGVGDLQAAGTRDPAFLHHLEYDLKTDLEGEDCYYIVARILYELIEKHPFWDGNKRTAFATSTILLAMGNRTLDVPDEEVEEFCLALASKFEMEKKDLLDEKELPKIEDVADWFESNSSRMPMFYYFGMFLGMALVFWIVLSLTPYSVVQRGLEKVLNRLRGA